VTVISVNLLFNVVGDRPDEAREWQRRCKRQDAAAPSTCRTDVHRSPSAIKAHGYQDRRSISDWIVFEA